MSELEQKLIDLNIDLLWQMRSHKVSYGQYLGLMLERNHIINTVKKNNVEEAWSSVSDELKKICARMEEKRNNSINHLKQIAALQEQITEMELIHDLNSDTMKLAIGSQYNFRFPSEPIRLINGTQSLLAA